MASAREKQLEREVKFARDLAYRMGQAHAAKCEEAERLRTRVKELEQLTRDTAWELDRMCAHSRLLRTAPVRQMAVAYPLAITQLAKVADALGELKLTASLADDIDQAARALEAK